MISRVTRETWRAKFFRCFRRVSTPFFCLALHCLRSAVFVAAYTNPGSRRLYRLGVSQTQKAEVSGDERPRLRASVYAPNFPIPTSNGIVVANVTKLLVTYVSYLTLAFFPYFLHSDNNSEHTAWSFPTSISDSFREWRRLSANDQTLHQQR